MNQKIEQIWRQGGIALLWRTGAKGDSLYVKLPYAADNKAWLHKPGGNLPAWNPQMKCWTVPVGWFNDSVDKCLARFGKVYIVQPYREQEKCSPACQNATGHVCQCSCMGEHHGAGSDGSWFEVSETFATRWHEREIAARLLTTK